MSSRVHVCLHVHIHVHVHVLGHGIFTHVRMYGHSAQFSSLDGVCVRCDLRTALFRPVCSLHILLRPCVSHTQSHDHDIIMMSFCHGFYL